MIYPKKNIQTDLALAVTSLFKKETEVYMTLAFDCYWKENMNLNNQNMLDNILAKTSLDINLLDNPNSLIDTLKDDTAIAKDQGVISTPTYQIGEELFLGREHLPWIQKILEDQS